MEISKITLGNLINVSVWTSSLLILSMVTSCLYPLYYLNQRINNRMYTKPGYCKSNLLIYFSSFITIDPQNDVFYLQRFFYHIVVIVLTFCSAFSKMNVFSRLFVFLLSRLFLLNVNFDHILGHETFIPLKYRKHGYKYDTIYFLILYVFPLFNLSGVPGSWPNQHTHMHHKENNSANDLQTLIYFKRNSLWNAIWFAIGEVFNHHFRLLFWHHKMKSGRTLNVLCCNIAFFSHNLLLFLFDFKLGLFAFLWHYGYMLLGNLFVEFVQHCLVDPLKPYDVESNTVSLLKPSVYFKGNEVFEIKNSFVFSDNLHHEHSFDSNVSFGKSVDLFVKRFNSGDYKNAMIFDLDPFMFLYAVIFSKFDLLADVWVTRSKNKWSHDQIVLLMKKNVEPVCSYHEIPWAKLPKWPTCIFE
jgi:hypothetical protein